MKTLVGIAMVAANVVIATLIVITRVVVATIVIITSAIPVAIVVLWSHDLMLFLLGSTFELATRLSSYTFPPLFPSLQ